MKRFFSQSALFCLLVLTVQTVISFDWEWKRDLATGNIEALRIGVPVPYQPEAEIRAVQQYQVEHPLLGFLWRPSISVDDNVVIGWGDVPAGAITTDDIGFANSEEAAEARRTGEPVDIIGVGASYMGGANNLFNEYFALNGYSYHNMAHGRYTLPQYNIALKHYAIPQKPKWILYGMNEVSHTLIPDFEAWHQSGMGWFDFHSGTWCGPPVKSGFPHDWLLRFPRLYRLFQSFMKKTFRGVLNSRPSRKELVRKTVAYIENARDVCRENGIGFVVLCIPSKVRMVQGPLPSLYLFEDIVPELKKSGIPCIDLRENFSRIDDPSTLYFQQDAHWNRTGVYRAAREVLAFIEHHQHNQENGNHP